METSIYNTLAPSEQIDSNSAGATSDHNYGAQVVILPNLRPGELQIMKKILNTKNRCLYIQ